VAKKEKEFEEGDEHEVEEVTPEHVEEALQRYAEDYRGKSGVDPSDHPHFIKAKALLQKMKCR
jgi:hypothetical protein